MPRARRGMPHLRRVVLLAGAAVGPWAVTALLLLWTTPHADPVRWTLLAVLGLTTAFALSALREAVARPLQTLGNLTGALREEDFSFRVRTDGSDDPLNLALVELNGLVETLREQRLGAVEASALLRKVLAELEVAVLVLDGGGRLHLVNRAGERLLGAPSERLLGLHAEELGLGELRRPGPARVVDLTLPSASGRFEVHHGRVRQGGRPLELIVLADVSRALREEERQAWQRLVRVLGHELNNSLTPIRSVAASLLELLGRQPRAQDWEDDARRGLAVIAGRAAALSRFMDGYARLARLPPPDRRRVAVRSVVDAACRLESRVAVAVQPGPDLTVEADPDQLEQALINLVRNAADASLETGGAVRVGWDAADGHLDVWVEDDGPGLPPSANLFVPFFTTKPQGSGIGLVLSRQIVEGHGGSLALANRDDGGGCRARLRLPC